MNETTKANPSDTAQQNDSCCSESSCCGPQAPFVRMSQKIGRNDPCPCNSGRKYKKCCGFNA